MSLLLCALACSSDDERSRAPVDGPDQSEPGAGGSQSSEPGPSESGTGNGTGGGAGASGEQQEQLPIQPGTSEDPADPSDAPDPNDDEPLGPPTQTPLPALPSVRQEHSVVALAGEVYVIAGFTPAVTATVEAFNPATGSWRSVADLPVALHHANAAALNGKLYVAGFYVGGSFNDAGGNVFEYDPALDEWSERALMAPGRERASSCVAAFDGKIYLFGGARGGTVSDASFYDVAANAWRELPPLPEPREHCIAGEIAGTLYVAAGRSGGIGGFEPSTWAFDPVLETYTERAPIATPRGGVAGAVLGGKLYVFGGEGNDADPTGVFDEIEAFDPAANAWEALPAMLEPRHGLAAAELGGSIYLPGGATTQGFGAAAAHTVMVFAAPAP